MMRWLVPVSIVVACACPSKPEVRGNGSGSGIVEKPPIDKPPIGKATTCAELRPKLEQLYRAEAQAKDSKRVEETVADNTTMVLNDCAKASDKVVACVNAAATVVEIESRCVQPLDDEGSEGLELRK